MIRPMTKIVNGDVEIIREMTEQEHTDYLEMQAYLEQQAQAKAEALAGAEIAKAALLAKLGITEEEARLLLS